MFNKLKRYTRDPYYALGNDMIKKCPHLMSDKFYLSVLWKMVMGYKLDWKHPKTFNEKLQWLKLYDRNPLYTTLVDKYRVKQWVADKIGEQYVIPTLAVYNSVDEINLDELPDQFVLQCNHDSGSVVICRDKSSFDFETAKRRLGEALKKNFYWEAREWPYKNVKPCVFAEKFMKDSAMNDDLTDYNVFVYKGQPNIIKVDIELFKWHKCKLYDLHWNYIDAQIHHLKQSNRVFDRFKALEKMFDLYKRLGEYFRQLRADFYLIDDKVFFGELTFYRGGGFEKFNPQEIGLQIGDYIQLPEIKRFKTAWMIVNEEFIIYLHLESDIPAFVGLKDYKWFCFDGMPKVMYIANDRAEFPTTNFYDMDFNPLLIYTKDPPAFESPEKPARFEKMKTMASKLSKGIPQIRVGFYENDNSIYFGEMTFSHAGGFAEVHPREWNLRMGDWIKLPTDK